MGGDAGLPAGSLADRATQLAILNESLAIVSILGSLVVVSSYVLFPSLRKLSFRLIVHLALSNLLFETDVFVGATESVGSACVVHTVLQSWFSLASVFWTVVISYCMFSAVINQRQSEQRMPLFVLFAYSCPLMLAVLPLAAFLRSHEAQWCWANPTSQTTSDRVALIWRGATFYVPHMLCVLYHFVVFRRLQLYVGMMGRLAGAGLTEEQQSNTGLLDTIDRLRIYPVILLVCWLPGLLNRLQNLLDPSHPVLLLQVLHIVGRALQGPLNAMAYSRLPGVRKAWAQALKHSSRGPSFRLSDCLRLRARRDSGPSVDDSQGGGDNGGLMCRCLSAGLLSLGCELGGLATGSRRRRSSLEGLIEHEAGAREVKEEDGDDDMWTHLDVTGRFDEQEQEEEEGPPSGGMQQMEIEQGSKASSPAKEAVGPSPVSSPADFGAQREHMDYI